MTAALTAGRADAGGPVPEIRALHVALREFEREYLVRAMSQASGKRVRAAEMLGISRKSLWEKLRLHGISDAETEAREQGDPGPS
jgi:DNA-binding NtrC family response regulator